MKIATAFLLSVLATSMLSAAERIDPKALASLKRMSDTLASAKAFTFKSRTIYEVPTGNGQSLTVFSTAEVALKRPDKLRAILRGGAPWFDFFYNGEIISAYAPVPKVYSIGQAPPSLDALLSGHDQENSYRFVSAPIFVSDPYPFLTKTLVSAVVVGPDMVQGTPCEHLAFRSQRVNWEIWIESNARALPSRLSVTFTDRADRPRTLVEFSHWNLHPWLFDGSFVFRKPGKATEVPFASVLEAAANK